MHFSLSTTTMPSSPRFEMAPAGHTAAHAGSAQCMHDIDTNVRVTFGKVPLSTSCTLRRAMVPASMPFHCLQAISHAQHLMQRSVSI